MKKLVEYINHEIGLKFFVEDFDKHWNKQLPLYLSANYDIKKAQIEEQKIALVLVKLTDEQPTIGQMHKQMNGIRQVVQCPVVFVFDQLEAFKRNRLVQLQMNFIVPFKQLFLPELLMAFTEIRHVKPTETHCFIPMAQVLCIYWILSNNEDATIEELSFNKLALLFNINAMAITRAVENLSELDICTIDTGRPKYINFKYNKQETWTIIKQRHLGINPVQKTVYIDTLPPQKQWLKTNTDALTAYTDINPGQQPFFAIDKATYQAYKKTSQWPKENHSEGTYAVEVWKYNPELLQKRLPWLEGNIDPLSIYFCFTDDEDERIEEALGQIENRYIW